jgi:TetR/AcrR family transcriptional repressor of nem operon
MSYHSEHKQQTRARILAEAANAIHALGPEHISVAGIMARAGLTHGGFYSHFASKDELVVQTLSLMFEQAYERFVNRTLHADPLRGLEHLIDVYVSPAHRDTPQRGCPIPSLASDLPRMSEPVKQRFGAGLERLTKSMARRLQQLGATNAEDLATTMLAQMIGAVALSRAVTDRAASDLMLQTSRDALKGRLHAIG